MNGTGDSGLGSVLVDSGIITKEQLNAAIQAQKISGHRLKDVLINEGYTTKEELKQFISEHLDIPYVKLTKDLIDPEAVKLIPANVARNHIAIPITKVGNILTMAVSCPFDTTALDMLAFTSGYNLEPVLSDEEDILEAIDFFFQGGGLEEEIMEWDDDRLEVIDRYRPESVEEIRIDEGPVIKLANTLLSRAIKERASDIHIEPEEGLTRVRYRIDGVLSVAKIIPVEAHNALVSRIKVMADLDISEKRHPQDGRFFVRYKGKDVDFRIATAATINGESLNLRILDQSNAGVILADLGFEGEDLKKVMRALEEPHGFILVTGPTGSGKTTTLYAMLNEITDLKNKIITIEDPVEYRLNVINQIPVNTKIGLDFATILRSVLRQDPDIILVGEIRDKETASIAVQAALTGHLLLSSLHTTGASETLGRLIEMGVEPYYLREVVNLIVAQRLTRKLCPRCKEKYVPDLEVTNELGLPAGANYFFYRAVGCSQCGDTGYKGRMGVYEVMLMSRELKGMISLDISPNTIKETAVERGMATMWHNAAMKVLSGVTSVEEIRRTIPK